MTETPKFRMASLLAGASYRGGIAKGGEVLDGLSPASLPKVGLACLLPRE